MAQGPEKSSNPPQNSSAHIFFCNRINLCSVILVNEELIELTNITIPLIVIL